MGKIASKDEERNALAKIREIVDSLGETSYIGIAMEGMWELIEENIADDFGNSHRDMIAHRDNEIKRLNDEVSIERANATRIQNEFNHALERIADLECTIKSDTDWIDRLSKTRDEIESKYVTLDHAYHALEEKTENEIVRLKANLYDFMEKEGKGAN